MLSELNFFEFAWIFDGHKARGLRIVVYDIGIKQHYNAIFYESNVASSLWSYSHFFSLNLRDISDNVTIFASTAHFNGIGFTANHRAYFLSVN